MLRNRLSPARLRDWATAKLGRDKSQDGRPASEHDAIVASGLFDLDWYSAEAGQQFSGLDDAVAHYLQIGFTHRYSPNPLLDHMPEEFDGSPLTPMGRYVLGEYGTTSAPHPAWSLPRHVQSHPESVDHPYGPLGHIYADFGPETVLFLRGPDRLKRVRWKNIEPQWRELATTWTRKRRNLLPAWSTELSTAHQTSSWPQNTPHPDVTVTVVIATWNRAHSLATALASVQAQSWSKWEAIVVDDGSSDGTATLVRSISAKDPRIRLIVRPHEGVCAARNAGIAEARGEFVAFLDSDNTWRPDFLRHMVLSMHREHLDAAYATLAVMSPDGPKYRARQVTDEILHVQNHIDLNVLMVRATTLALVGGFDPYLRRTVDYDLVLRLTRTTALVHVPMIGADYDSDGDRSDRISVQEPAAWSDVVRLKHLIDWPELAGAPRRNELLSVVVPTGKQPGETHERIKAARAELGTDDWEMIIVDHSISRRTFHSVLPILLTDARIRYERIPFPHSFAFTANVGFSKTRGAHVLFLDFDTRPQPGTITALAAAARGHDGPYLVEPQAPSRGPAGRTFMVRASDFIKVHGLQPLLYNQFEVADLRHRLLDAVPQLECEVLAEAPVDRLSTTRVHAQHADNLRHFTEVHGHEPCEYLQRR